ncbi:hypothetical protein BVRB_014610, partial [Beta vulgaris subsp. vulgaris]|jgi:hypothetical protein
MED